MFPTVIQRKVPAAVLQGVRFYAKTPAQRLSKRVNVQLLKDHPVLGVRGQIVSVKPAFMRQQLHPQKLAAYAITGPKIPVVEKKAVPVEESAEKTKANPETKESEDVGAMSLDELSQLFNNMRQTRGRNSKPQSMNVNTDATTITYSASDVREYIPVNNTIVIDHQVTFPVSKDYLSSYAFKVSGLDIPTSAIRIINNANIPVHTVSEAGEYSWMINTPEQKEVEVKLVVRDSTL